MQNLLLGQISIVLLAVLLSSCRPMTAEELAEETNGETETETESPTKSQPASRTSSGQVAIEAVLPLVAQKGESLTITGSDFSEDLTLKIGSSVVTDFTVVNERTIKTTMPELDRRGEFSLSVIQDGETATTRLLYAGVSNDFPISTKLPSEICSGEKFYDAAGQLQVGTRVCNTTAAPADCQTDGQVGCVTTTNYPSVAKLAIDPWSIRAGETVAGVSGALKTSCRNRGTTSIFNSGSAALDVFDTLEDFNANGAVPTSLVSGWSSNFDCYASVWQDITADGTCNTTSEDCLMKDRITGLTWSESSPVAGAAPSNAIVSWANAVSGCDTLVFGTYSDWRLPTQKELLEAYVHGIRAIGYNGSGATRTQGSLDNNNAFINNVDDYFWSGTTYSSDINTAWRHHLGHGAGMNETKAGGYPFLCVRP